MADKSSGQKTEKPTPKRLREARRKGQIARSPDLVGWISLLAASYVMPLVLRMLQDRFLIYFLRSTEFVAVGEWRQAMAVSRDLVSGTAMVFLPFLALLVLITIVAMVAQGGVVLSAEPLRPKMERISPKAGLKRLVSPQSVVDTAKAVLRLVALAILMWMIMGGQIAPFLTGAARSPVTGGLELGAAILLLVRLAALLGVVIGLGDYAFQRWKTARQLRMTKEEVKRENRNTEGDPLSRGRRRAMHAQVSRNKMLSAVGDASVVIVNPTHVSVALSYAAGAVPTVVAKGVDELALRIRERANEEGVPIVESPPLARALNEFIEVGEEVPAHLYEAVAIVIAFVMRLPPTALRGVVRQVAVPASKLRRPERDESGEAVADPAGADADEPIVAEPGRGRRRRRPTRTG